MTSSLACKLVHARSGVKTVVSIAVLVAGSLSGGAGAAAGPSQKPPKAPPEVPSITASSVGALTSAAQFCGEIDPHHRQQFEQNVVQALKGIKPKDIDVMKALGDFKNAYVVVDGVLRAARRADAEQLCSASLS
jgi:hypothetical protein